MHWKSIVTELLWFLRGDTNIKYLVDNGVHIWDGDAYKKYGQTIISEGYQNLVAIGWPSTQEEFVERIKTDIDFAKQWGELGPIYGKQWRDWKKPHWTESELSIASGGVQGGSSYTPIHIDQIANLISELKTNPDSRRLMVNAWNCSDLDSMVLPPCHYGFQVYTRELSLEERVNLLKNIDTSLIPTSNVMQSIVEPLFVENNIPTRAISLMWNQRSVDTFLGLPFNIASYGLLLEIIAKEVNMVPDELIGNLGDVHLYSNHIEQAKEQIGRDLTITERIDLYKKQQNLSEDATVTFNVDYNSGAHFILDEYNIPKRTREPFELPTITITERNWYLHEKVKEHLGEKTFIEKIESYRPEDFTLNNYQSHPSIKAPLSN